MSRLVAFSALEEFRLGMFSDTIVGLPTVFQYAADWRSCARVWLAF